MSDYFALLGEPRQPCLDPEALKAKFFGLSASVHPDRAHSLPEGDRKVAHERYTELNAAYQCLREPRERLSHLIVLETGRKPAAVQQVPEAFVQLFFQIGEACRLADAFLKRKAGVNSPLLLAGFFEEGQEISERLAALHQDLQQRQEALFEQMSKINSTWREHLPKLETIQQSLSYLHRWAAQLNERISQLAA